MSTRRLPSRRTMKQINDVFRDQLGGHVITEVEHHNGLLEFWKVGSRVVIVHAYGDRDGWTHYIESREQNIKRIVDELR